MNVPTAELPPTGRVLELTRSPSIALFLWVLVPVVVFVATIPAALLLLEGPAVGVVLVPGFAVTLVLIGVVFSVVARRRTVAYRLVLAPHGVFLVHANGSVVGRLGVAPLTLTPGHWLSAAKGVTKSNQCVLVGAWLSIGTYGAFAPYRAHVPMLACPEFALQPPKWAELVQALPELRALQ